MVIKSIRGHNFEFLYKNYRFDTVWKVPSFVRKYQDASSFVRLASKATLTQPSALPLGSKQARKKALFDRYLPNPHGILASPFSVGLGKKNFDGHSYFPFYFDG